MSTLQEILTLLKDLHIIVKDSQKRCIRVETRLTSLANQLKLDVKAHAK